jgi:hypothetical protein
VIVVFGSTIAAAARAYAGLSKSGLASVAFAINLDRTFEVRVILKKDAGGCEVADDGTVLLNFNAIADSQIALDTPMDNNFPRDDVADQLRVRSDAELVGFQVNSAFDGAIYVQVFLPRDVTFDV